MSAKGTDSAARRFLTKAFSRAQAARSRGDTTPSKLLLSQSQCPEFFAMRDFDQATQFRAELATAEREGAIRLVPGKRKTPPHDVAAIIVADLNRLGTRLGLDVRADQVEEARRRLSPFLAALPVLEQVLDRWNLGNTVRGASPTDDVVSALIDAIRVRFERQGRNDEVLLRRLSSHLFKDSKRIESLGRWLDLLEEGSLTSSGLSRHEVFSNLGLHKEPQPFLIAADASVSTGHGELRLLRPFTGLPTSAVQEFIFDPMPDYVVTVENKSTFHELATLAERKPACVIYTGGMPSPAWKQLYSRALASIPDCVPLYHFGDVDVGGFRIARVINEVTLKFGRKLRPWSMNPATLRKAGYELRPAKQAHITAMQSSCERIDWHEIADAIAHVPGTLEQEHIEPQLPGYVDPRSTDDAANGPSAIV